MQTLKGMNFDKSLALLEDFVRSVPSENFNEVLKGKKTQAELALAHFEELFQDEPVGNNCKCEAGQKSQAHPGPPPS